MGRPLRAPGRSAPVSLGSRGTWLGICFLLVLIGCAPGRTPELLDVVEVSPTVLEQGARLELLGSGFPDRRRARLTFSGLVHRPGRTPEEVTIRLEGNTESRSLVSVPVTREVLRRFAGDAPHATFRGRVTATFASASRTSPALTGSHDAVVIDWFNTPSERLESEEDLRREALRFLDFVGLQVDESLVVTRVDEDGPAHQAGLLPRDRLVELDGVRLDGLADLVPRADGIDSRLVVRREPSEEALVTLSRHGFRPARLEDLPRGFVWVVAVLALLLVTAGSRARAWALIEDSLSRRRTTFRAGAKTSLFLLLSTKSPTLWARELHPVLRFFPYATMFGVFALWSALAVAHPALAWVDFPAVLLSILVSAVLGALIIGGYETSGQGWRLTNGLREATRTLLSWIPVVLASVAVVLETGSLRIVDLVAGQGQLPHEWRAFSSPWLLVSFVLLVGTCIPEIGPRPSPWCTAPPKTSMGATLARLLPDLAVGLTCGLGAALFLGGWQPALSAANSPQLSFVSGAALFLLKTWLLLHAVFWWRGVLGGIRQCDVAGLWARHGLPVAALCFCLQLLSTSFTWTSGFEHEMRLSTLTLTGTVGSYLVVRAVRALRGPVAHATLNPWL